MLLMRAWGTVLRFILACSMPGRRTSPAYCAAPVTLARMSERRTELPTTFMSPTLELLRRLLAFTAKLFRRLLDRIDDARVAGAAADVAREPEADLGFARRRVFVQQRLRHHQNPRRAEPALGAAKPDEAVLQRMKRAIGRLQAFDRIDARALGLDAEHEARIHRLAVEDDGAGAAVSDVASLLRSAQARFVAQHVQQAAIGLERELDPLAVQGEGDDTLHAAALRRASSSARRVRTRTISLR